jgi:hypothetical protein
VPHHQSGENLEGGYLLFFVVAQGYLLLLFFKLFVVVENIRSG